MGGGKKKKNTKNNQRKNKSEKGSNNTPSQQIKGSEDGDNVQDDSLCDKLNDAQILDDSTEIIILKANSTNNNEDEKLLKTTNTTTTSANIIDTNEIIAPKSGTAEVSKSSNKSTTNKINENTTSKESGDSPSFKRDLFEVPYSGSISLTRTINNNEDYYKKTTSSAGRRENDAPKFGKKVENILPGGDLKTIEDYITLGVPRHYAEMKHPLQDLWTFWYFKGDKSLKWEERQVQLADVDTVEDFWQIYNYIEPASKIGIGSDYALFKKGIMPDWEDFKNMYGGRWVLEWRECDLKNYDDLDTFWLETLFILIGAHGEPYHDIVNGAVINVRKQRYRIAVWLKESPNRNEKGVRHIGHLLKKRLELKTNIYFNIHAEESGPGSGSKRGSRQGHHKVQQLYV